MSAFSNSVILFCNSYYSFLYIVLHNFFLSQFRVVWRVLLHSHCVCFTNIIALHICSRIVLRIKRAKLKISYTIHFVTFECWTVCVAIQSDLSVEADVSWMWVLYKSITKLKWRSVTVTYFCNIKVMHNSHNSYIFSQQVNCLKRVANSSHVLKSH